MTFDRFTRDSYLWSSQMCNAAIEQKNNKMACLWNHIDRHNRLQCFFAEILFPSHVTNAIIRQWHSNDTTNTQNNDNNNNIFNTSFNVKFSITIYKCCTRLVPKYWTFEDSFHIISTQRDTTWMRNRGFSSLD